MQIAGTMVRWCACALAGVGLSLAMGSLPVRGQSAERANAVVEIPFEFGTRQPIVSVRINGGDAVPFIVDTGASVHVIDASVARAAGVSGGPSRSMSGGGQAAAQVQTAERVRVEAGGLVWDGQRAVISNLGYPSRHFAGLIGAPILMQYTVQFAFDTRTLRLFDPERYAPPPAAVLVPFELQDDLPVVRVQLDAGAGPIEARLMVDTGASQFIDLNRPFVEQHRLIAAMPDAALSDRPAALGGAAPFSYGTARRVTFGGVAFEQPRIGLSRAETGSSSRSDRDGIIGNDLLRHFVVTVDYRRRALVLERPAADR